MSCDLSLLLRLGLLIALARCGRVGYDPARTVGGGVDGAADATSLVDAPAVETVPPADRSQADAAAEVPPTPVDTSPPPDVVEAPPRDVVEAPLPDVAEAPAPDTAPPCPPTPAADDWIADFEAGVPSMRAAGGRRAQRFTLVRTGEGQMTVAPYPGGGTCNNSLYLSLAGTNITAGRGHIQGQFFSSAVPQAWEYFDARAYRGIRMSLRASVPADVSFKVADRATVGSLPYDHFARILMVTTSWQTITVSWTDLRQSGNGTPRGALDVAALVAIELGVLRLSTFELQVDDIVFVR